MNIEELQNELLQAKDLIKQLNEAQEVSKLEREALENRLSETSTENERLQSRNNELFKRVVQSSELPPQPDADVIPAHEEEVPAKTWKEYIRDEYKDLPENLPFNI